ncbi:MAG: hypothetical protein GF417_09050 [Candidatus Latescibacteria bacterium]|nr:hypothetical protein [bacterium]MBD3424570.1 hypothetical protein [Candidatus Latescibacterota bacterium]
MIIIILFLSCSVLTLLLDRGPERRKIVLSEPGVGDFNVPEYGSYGRYGVGYFGVLLHLLEDFGYTYSIAEKAITEELLGDADIFVVINRTEEFSAEEHDVIWEFVREGGALLVLGDHTDIKGIMVYSNSLLEPVGIRYNFDSAMSSNMRWKSCYHKLNHPVLHEMSEDQIQTSVGASLYVGYSAFPVLIGKYGYSDWGNYLDVDRAYLGDYEYNHGEQLGDVILVAGSYYGDGRVLAFGDTSPFQNASIAYSYQYILNIFSWLSGEATAGQYYLRILLSILLLLSAIILALQLNRTEVFILFPVVMLVSLIASSILNQSQADTVRLNDSAVFIDYSHGETFNYQSSTENSVDGFITNILRNGYICYLIRDFSNSRIENGEILVLIAPTESFSNKEIEYIRNYVSHGGLLIINTGYPYRDAVQPLLTEFELDILNLPLGPVPYIEEDPTAHMMEPKFVDCWPIMSFNDESESFFSVELGENEYDLVVFRKYEEGGILLISDSEFLLNHNLESLNKYWPGNIKFLKDIFDEMSEREVLKSKD